MKQIHIEQGKGFWWENDAAKAFANSEYPTKTTRAAILKEYQKEYGKPAPEHFMSDRYIGYVEFYKHKHFFRYCEHDRITTDPASYAKLTTLYPNRKPKWLRNCYPCFEQVKEYKQPEEEVQPEVEKELTEPEAVDTGLFGKAFSDMLTGMDEIVEKHVTGLVETKFDDVKAILDSHKVLVVKSGDNENKVAGLKHNKLEDLFIFAGNNVPTLLVGPPGTGKSAAGQQVAEGLGITFEAMSVGMQTSKSDILGYMSATGQYVETGFRRAFEQGGVFLMDEIDAGNSNVLIVLNTALSNDYCAFPDKMVKRHKDFKFIGTANTYGNGATQQFVGRNQLDAATLDRFAIIEWNIDEKLETALASGFENGPKWHAVVLGIREYAEKNVGSSIVSPRATLKGAALLDAGIKIDDVIQATILGQIPIGNHSDVKKRAKDLWNKGGVPASGGTAKASPKFRDEVAW